MIENKKAVLRKRYTSETDKLGGILFQEISMLTVKLIFKHTMPMCNCGQFTKPYQVYKDAKQTDSTFTRNSTCSTFPLLILPFIHLLITVDIKKMLIGKDKLDKYL